MLHFSRKRTNAFIHTIYIYLFEHRKGGYYTQYIFFIYIIINQVHFQMHALLKCSIFLVVSTYVMIYWEVRYTWNYHQLCHPQYIHLEFFQCGSYLVWNYQVYTMKVIIISFTVHNNHGECSTY